MAMAIPTNWIVSEKQSAEWSTEVLVEGTVMMNEMLSHGQSCDTDWEYHMERTGAAESRDSVVLL